MKKSKINIDNSLQNMSKLFEIISKLDLDNLEDLDLKTIKKEVDNISNDINKDYKNYKNNLDSKK